MKTKKSKPQKKVSRKTVKKHIEKSLSDKFFEAVKGLGHNAEVIADDISVLSKAAAKKLAKKFTKVKSLVGDKIESVIATGKTPQKKVKLAKKDASKLMKKVDKSVTKVVKKAVKKAKPLTSSVKVQKIASEKKAAAALEPAKVKTTRSKKMATKSDSNTSAKKAVVKAVTNNPVKKVAKKAIPTKKNTTGSTSTKK